VAESRSITGGRGPLTSNTVWLGAPRNVLLSSKATGLPKDSVAE
jgi:hypothetical protein